MQIKRSFNVDFVYHQGPQGPSGRPGPDGPTGALGAGGNSGLLGSTGPRGRAGEDGYSGASGPPGKPGLPGPPGGMGVNFAYPQVGALEKGPMYGGYYQQRYYRSEKNEEQSTENGAPKVCTDYLNSLIGSWPPSYQHRF